MRNFAREGDLIWGGAFDESLGERIKVTILAAGFDVSLSNEGPTHTGAKTPKKVTAATSIIDEPDPGTRERLADIYGTRKVSETAQIRARARYKVLLPDEFDDDDVILEIEKNPTLNRSTKFIPKAMLARDHARLLALRGVKKEFLEAKTAEGAGGELTDATATKIIAKMVKQRKESAAIYTGQNRDDLEQSELA